MMRKKVVSFDRFYEQKSNDYFKLINQNPSLRQKTDKRRRLFTYQNRCSTETSYDTITSKRSIGPFPMANLQSRAQSPDKMNKTSIILKRNDRLSQKQYKKAVHVETEENLFTNSYLRQRLKLSKISQCKTRMIVFAQKFDQGSNGHKSFKIRSNKFNLLSNTVNSKQYLTGFDNQKRQYTNPQSFFLFNQ